MIDTYINTINNNIEDLQSGGSTAMTIAEANAGTVTAARTISPKVLTDAIAAYSMYGTCTTAAATAAKVVTVVTPTPADLISLKAGMTIAVKFTNANTAASPTLNVDGLGAKPIHYRGAVLATSVGAWSANQYVLFKYDGTNWILLTSIEANRIPNIETRLSTTETNIANHETRITGTENRVTNVEVRVFGPDYDPDNPDGGDGGFAE